MNVRNHKTIKERRISIEKTCCVSLPSIGIYPSGVEVAGEKNCENMIGVTHIPLGIAGPLTISFLSSMNKELGTKNYLVPLATTEGALVASVNRGCKAITESGGAVGAFDEVGVTRGPVFKTSGISESLKLKQWIEDREKELKKLAQSTSSHLILSKYGIRVAGKHVYVRFYFHTEEAMGMNMATIATNAIVEHIAKKTQAECVSVAGNFDIDKKPAWLNSISGRGKRVWADVTLPQSVLRSVLKTTAQKMYDTWLSKCMLGSAMSGSLGFNAQFANVISAMFIATGQDPAHVVEGSIGITTTEIVGNSSLYVSIYLPDLMVGTIGGGTGLPSQKEALDILGVAGGDKGKNAMRFAHIIGGAVLAGEISLLASLSEGTLAKAHKKLARGNRSTL